MDLSAVVILAAGQGTRMKSATPKLLHEVCGRTLLGHAITAARSLNPQHIVVVVRHERERVAAHARELDDSVIIADQDEIKGTGRAVWCGMEALGADVTGPVLVMAGDTPLLGGEILGELARAHGNGAYKNDAAATAQALPASPAVTVLSARVPDPAGYGRIVRDSQGTICAVVEDRDASAQQRAIDEINTSTYIFDAAFLREALATLGTDNAQGEMYLTDVVARTYQLGAGVGSYVSSDYLAAEGANDLVQLAALRREMNRRIGEKWMRSGVSIIDPATAWIDVQVELEPDCVVEPNSILRGATRVARFGHVGPGELSNVIVEEGARARHVYLRDCLIPAGKCARHAVALGEAAQHRCGG
ncbi:NTP transferase domain-containing protein [Actinotignum sp. GS-2025f]|uniref:NTP transferase domain-containing protein n=1 Tax=Actinotignum TaxID=1653174 RepID=UPI00254E40BB|nr:NTP transferase domain-containing protein [Actinotignum sanguinis]MDK6787646.1 NTP transferase domain-containing protein [Actinotignum timonense]MDK8285992.1 NTP transferase domain-containing protein [Actinotignum sanguinis]MDK8650487.1 NTP transferase domain-containing protein [Actinotignum sanguinis]MDK8800844.1 NTP transferase domain-containing protein [Actinotignum sanguinis]